MLIGSRQSDEVRWTVPQCASFGGATLGSSLRKVCACIVKAQARLYCLAYEKFNGRHRLPSLRMTWCTFRAQCSLFPGFLPARITRYEMWCGISECCTPRCSEAVSRQVGETIFSDDRGPNLLPRIPSSERPPAIRHLFHSCFARRSSSSALQYRRLSKMLTQPSTTIVVLCTVLPFLDVVLVLLRLWAQGIRQQKLNIDDILIVAALVSI